MRVRDSALDYQGPVDLIITDPEAGRMHGCLVLKPSVQFLPHLRINLGRHNERGAGGAPLSSPSSTTTSPALMT